LIAEGADACRMERSIPMAKAMDNILLAYGQNGEAIRPAKGYPLRLIIPGWEGNTNVKWLQRLRVTDQPYMVKNSRRIDMNKMHYVYGAMAVCSLGSLGMVSAQAPKALPQPMGFFVTGSGVGKGADLGGLAGADQHCQKLAAAAGAGNRTWRAYLSASASGGQAAGNARDRIGQGPWYNGQGGPHRSKPGGSARRHSGSRASRQ
jgi:DMSO/TMAO reductase YedYZ molybdopterin-dependent catalytic subunit